MCCGRDCLGYSAHQACTICTRQTLAMFCFLQPLLVCLITVVNRSRTEDLNSTVQWCELHVNNSALVYKHNVEQNSSSIVLLDVTASFCTEVDYVVIVMPFAAMVSMTTLCWVKLTSMKEIGEDTLWDESVYTAAEDESVFLYDLTYCVELWFMNFAFIVASASEQSFWKSYYTTHAVTVGIVFFVASSRYSHNTITEHWIGTVFFGYILSVLVPFWNNAVQGQCVVSVTLAVTHAFCVFLVVCGHYIAMGVSTAGYILLLRITVTLIACTTTLIVLLVGRNQHC